MRIEETFPGRRMLFILAFICCVQGVSIELTASDVRPHQTIEEIDLEKKTDQLLLSMQKRLAIMHEVAKTKWNNNLPIEDLVREQQLLKDMTAKAAQYGIDEKWLATFFQAQMDAAKEIQKSDFALWKHEGVVLFDRVYSLKDDLRLYIDQINQEILGLLGEISKRGVASIGSFIPDRPISIRESDFIDENVWQLAISPLEL